MVAYVSDDPDFVPPPPPEPRWAMDVAPAYRADGLVAERPHDWFVQFDDPLYGGYAWVAMLDPEELSHHVAVSDLGRTNAGRPRDLVRHRAARSRATKRGCADCCDLLLGGVERRPSTTSSVSDVQTGVLVSDAACRTDERDWRLVNEILARLDDDVVRLGDERVRRTDSTSSVPHTGPRLGSGWRHATCPRPRHRDRHAADRTHQLGARRRRTWVSATSRSPGRPHAPGSAACTSRTRPTRRPLVGGGAVLNGLGDCTGFLSPPGVGAVRVAGLPDLDQPGRPGLRRGVPARAGPAPGAASTTSSCRWWPSATTPSSTTSAPCGWTRTTSARPTRRRWPRVARRHHPRRGRSARDRDVLPGVQGRHRYVVAGDARRPHRRGAADDELRPARPADGRRRPGRPAAAASTSTRRGRRARASASSSRTRRSTRSAASGWPAGSGSAWPGPARRPPRQRRDLPGRERHPRRPGRHRAATTAAGWACAAWTPCFEAVVDAAEESVLNSLLMSPTTVGRDGNTSEGLDPDAVVGSSRSTAVAGTERSVRSDGGRRRAGRLVDLPDAADPADQAGSAARAVGRADHARPAGRPRPRCGANGPGRKCGLSSPRCTDSHAAQSCWLVMSQNSTAPGAPDAADAAGSASCTRPRSGPVPAAPSGGS